MADEIKIPDFNLGDDFSENPEPPKPEKKQTEAEVKQKPKLLFEDDFKTDSIEETKKTPSETKEEPISDISSEPQPKKKRTLLWLIPLLIVIIIGGSFYLQTQGYFDFGLIFTKLGEVKNKIFGSGDTLNVAIPDTIKEKPITENKVENPYENQFLRKPKNSESDKELKEKTEPSNDIKKEITRSQDTKKEIKKEIKPKVTEKPEVTQFKKGTSKYSIQVSAWKLKSKAEYEANKFKRKGLDVRVVPVSIPEKGGTWFRVMIGSYNNMDEAKKQIDAIKKVTNSDNCIIREN